MFASFMEDDQLGSVAPRRHETCAVIAVGLGEPKADVTGDRSQPRPVTSGGNVLVRPTRG